MAVRVARVAVAGEAESRPGEALEGLPADLPEISSLANFYPSNPPSIFCSFGLSPPRQTVVNGTEGRRHCELHLLVSLWVCAAQPGGHARRGTGQQSDGVEGGGAGHEGADCGRR